MYHCGSQFVNPKIKRFSYGLDREKSMVKIRDRTGLGFGWDWGQDWARIRLGDRLVLGLDPSPNLIGYCLTRFNICAVT